MVKNLLLSSAFVLGLVLMVGCGKPAEPVAQNTTEKKVEKKDDTKHDGWWCDEHGVQEADCSMCSSKVAKKFKEKGDWCKLHDRAQSQCFICDPKLKDTFAAQYVAKYGKQPPEPEENKPEVKN